jgi:hypothetical protein
MSFTIFDDDKENQSSILMNKQQNQQQQLSTFYENQKQKFESQINQFRGDNVFPLCQQYLQLIQQHESRKSTTYLNTLYRLYKHIADNGGNYLVHVRNNEEYIRGWLLYISTLDGRQQHATFQYMNQKSIGLTNSLFYIAWASCLEEMELLDVAEQIYSAGRTRVKCSKLENMYTEFQERREVAEEEHRLEREEMRKKKSKQRERYQAKKSTALATSTTAQSHSKPSMEPAVGYNRQAVYSSNGEFSFEELRAQLPRYQVRTVRKPAPIQNPIQIYQDDDVEMELEDDNIIESRMEDEDIIHSFSKKPLDRPFFEIPEDETILPRNLDPEQPTLLALEQHKQQKQEKRAQERMEQLSQNISQQHIQQPSEPTPVPVVTQNNRRNTMIGKDDQTSDITVFTKSAFQEINSMFASDLGTEDELFFEYKKKNREMRKQTTAQPQQSQSFMFDIHEDSTQELRQQPVPQRTSPAPVQIFNDKENLSKPLLARRSFVPSMAAVNENTSAEQNRIPAKVERPARRMSQVPQQPARRRSSILPKTALPQQQRSRQSIRPSRQSLVNPRLSLLQAPDEEGFDEFDPNMSLYLDTATFDLANHDLSETINFSEIMSTTKDAAISALQDIRDKLNSYAHNYQFVVDPFNSAIIDHIQHTLAQAYSVHENRFNDERGKEAPSIPDDLKSKDSKENATIQLGTRTYIIYNLVGEGAYATVYCAKYQQADGGLSDSIAVKVQSPSCPWEFYICDQLQRRAEILFTERFIKPFRMFLYDKKSFMVMPYGGYGTLLDVINSWRNKNKCMEESMVMFYTIELLKIVHELHACQIIHGDIKPDNCLILHDSSKNDDNDWNAKGLILIDFGRSIDVSLYPDGTSFTGNYGASQFKCIEMQTNRPWTYQQDLYGICGVVHTMLFNKYMEVEQRPDTKKWALKDKVKRYYNVELWNDFFNTLLNIPDCSSIPNLKHFQTRFEEHIKQKQWSPVIRGLWYRQFMH